MLSTFNEHMIESSDTLHTRVLLSSETLESVLEAGVCWLGDCNGLRTMIIKAAICASGKESGSELTVEASIG